MPVSLVVGAAGFLGRPLVKALCARGQSVRAFDVKPPAGGGTPPAAPEWIAGDVRDREAVRRACQGAETVYHLASLIPQRRADAETMRAVNVGGTRNVLAAAAEAGVRRVVYLSSVEIFGAPAAAPCPEDGPLAPLGEYGRDKIESEHLCDEADADGLPVVRLRPPTIVGPGLDEPFLLDMFASLRAGTPVTILGRGENRFQFVHVDDVVSACILAAEHPAARGQAFNVGGANPPGIADCVRQVAARIGSASGVRSVPVWLARAAIALLRRFGKAPLEPEHVAITLCDYVFDIGKAERVLGWRPRWGIVDALADTYQWFAAESGAREG